MNLTDPPMADIQKKMRKESKHITRKVIKPQGNKAKKEEKNKGKLQKPSKNK